MKYKVEVFEQTLEGEFTFLEALELMRTMPYIPNKVKVLLPTGEVHYTDKRS